MEKELNNKELLELAMKVYEFERKNRSPIKKAEDLIVDTVKAPFKIVSRLFDWMI